jgi:flagellar basal-body rod protein FlgG
LFATAGPGVEERKPEGAKILQGFVEQSNVDAINAMSEMIDVLRGYESYQKVIQSLNDTTLKAINEVGRLE